MIPQKTIIQCMKDPNIFGRTLLFPHPDYRTWKNWELFLKKVYGLPVYSKEGKNFIVECTKRGDLIDKDKTPGFDNVFAIIGRRGGKSRISGLVAAYEALFVDWSKYLAPGEKAGIFVVAPQKKQAKIVFGYIRAFIRNYKASMIVREGEEFIELSNNVTILIQACSSRGLRGFSTAAIILDELAFFQSKDSGNPTEEVLKALSPTLLPKAKLFGISTPFGRWGYLFKIFSKAYGKPDKDVLVWRAPTKAMNPVYDMSRAGRMEALGLAGGGATEYEAFFREDVELYLPEAVLDAIIDIGVFVRPRKQGVRYFGFVDPSGGTGEDSMTLAIAHRKEKMVVLDLVVEKEPPYDVKEVTKKFSECFKHYNIGKIRGDKYAGDWPSAEFRTNGIHYEKCPDSKSKLYQEFGGIARLGQVSLLDDSTKEKKTKLQFMGLIRQTTSIEERIDHPRDGHDDIANVIAGVTVNIFETIRRIPSDDLSSRLPHILHQSSGTRVRPSFPGAKKATVEIVGGVERIDDKKEGTVASTKDAPKRKVKIEKNKTPAEEEMDKYISGDKVG